MGLKILYAVQATGNGHISRAITLLPHLKKQGEVDVFLSGSNSHLSPQLPIRYRSKGISLYYSNRGGLNYTKILLQRNPLTVLKEAKDLPVDRYDLVINDYDFITSLACRLKKTPSIHFGHQASFHYKEAPRPKLKNLFGELLLADYVQATHHVGLHFEKYHPSIFGAIVKEDFIKSEPSNLQHVTVYLPALPIKKLEVLLESIPAQKFEVFSKEVKFHYRFRNIFYYPIDQNQFNKSMLNCAGIICGAGFETPAEAMHLGKKILAVPIEGQYEQYCNAAGLAKMQVATTRIKNLKSEAIIKWLDNGQAVQKDYSKSTQEALQHIFSLPITQV